MAKYSIEIQDHEGNIYYPHSESATTFFEDGETLDTKVATMNQTISTKAPKDIATTSVNGLMSKEDKAKLNGIATGANKYVHPDSASVRHVTDTEKAKWNAKAETTLASTSANGLMSSVDKSKLDGIEAQANKYVHPNDTNTRHVTDAEKNTWNAKASTTLASSSVNGLMSSADKKKLDGIATGANNYVHPNDTSTRHVTDAEKSAWNGKASTSVATTLANGLMSKEDKSKLDGIATGANNYSHPSSHPASMITEDTSHKFVTTSEKNSIRDWANFKSTGGAIDGTVTAPRFDSSAFKRILPIPNFESGYSAGFGLETSDGSDSCVLAVGSDGSSDGNYSVYPFDHAVYNLGTSIHRWKTMFVDKSINYSENTNYLKAKPVTITGKVNYYRENFVNNGGHPAMFWRIEEDTLNSGLNQCGVYLLKHKEADTGIYGPYTDNKVQLGSVNRRWSDVWVGEFSKGASGYSKLPNGLIIQWGQYDSGSSVTEVQTKVTYPIAFPNRLLGFSASSIGYGHFYSDIMGYFSDKPNMYMNIRNRVLQPYGSGIYWYAIGY